MWKTGLFLSSLLLMACQQAVNSPPPQPTSTKVLEKLMLQNDALEYHCNGNKIIKVVEEKKNSKKTNLNQLSIRLTFENNTEHLMPAISETGKKYSNIKWQWLVKKDNTMLIATTGKVLAEQCIQ